MTEHAASLKQSVIRSAIGLALFAAVTGGAIAMTQSLTADRIRAQAAKAEAQALLDIVPGEHRAGRLLQDTVTLPASPAIGTGGPIIAWVARAGGSPTALVLPVTAPDGYSGNIRMLVGVDLDGTLLGVRVTRHQETPGLGDKIEVRKSDWVEGFVGRSLDNTTPNQWHVRKDGGVFDQFTGATITPRAVVAAVHNALLYVRDQRPAILARLNAPGRQPDATDTTPPPEASDP